MKTFISWSGEVSVQVARALNDWLRDVFPDLEPWMSDQSIQAGSRWTSDLNKELSESNFGILCLTPDNLQSLWLHFEAGALSKDLGSSRVIPYRFKLRATDVGPPLSQFQGVDADEPGTLKLIRSINSTKERPLESDRLERTFHKWWSDLEQKLQQIDVIAPQTPLRTDRDVFDEVVEQTRSLLRQSTERDQRNEDNFAALVSFAAIALLEREHDLSNLSKVKELAPVIVTWSKLAPNPEVLLRALTPEQVEYLAKCGYNIPQKLHEFFLSLKGDLGSSDPRDLKWIQETVGRAGSWATPYLIKALQLEDKEKRGHAAYLLGLTADPTAVSALTPLLSDTTELSLIQWMPRICDAAALALERIGTPEATTALKRWRRNSGGSH